MFATYFTFNLFTYVIFMQITQPANCVTNFLGEIFNDLRFGSYDTYKQKFDLKKPKCLQGSHHFNGSCYFISNRKYSDVSSYEADMLIETLMKTLKKNKKLATSALFDSTPIGTAAELATLPSETVWKNALNYCSQLNNDSTLLYFNNNNDEYHYIINLLKRLNFPDLEFKNVEETNLETEFFNEEQKYFIGLTYNNSVWNWINGLNLSDEFIKKFSLDKITYSSRKCSYLNLRDNGYVKIELTNCVNEKQPYICKYVLDRCFNNTMCGRNGECINLPHKKTFQCRCRLFYDGEKCEKWSTQGVQMLITVGLVLFGLTAVLVIKIANKIRYKCDEKKSRKNRYKNNQNFEISNEQPLLLYHNNRISVIKFESNPCKLMFKYLNKKKKLFSLISCSLLVAFSLIICVSLIRFKMIEFRISNFKEIYKNDPNKTIEDIDNTNTTSYLTKIFSYDLCNSMKDQFLEDYVIIYFSLTLTLIIYFWNAFKCNKNHEYCCKFSKHGGIRKCTSSGDVTSSSASRSDNFDSQQLDSMNNNEYTCFKVPIVNKSFKLPKKFTCFGFKCTCGIEFPIPMSPFSKRNRFITGVIYAAYTYNILKIFEYLLIGDQSLQVIDQSRNFLKNINLSNLTMQNMSQMSEKLSTKFHGFSDTASNYVERGILMDLLKQICSVLIIGLRYYPVLLCVELKRKSKFCYFLCTIYVLSLLFYYVYMNVFCLLSAMEAIKDAHNLKSNNGLNVPYLEAIKSKMPAELKSATNNTKQRMLLAAFNHRSTNSPGPTEIIKNETFKMRMDRSLGDNLKYEGMNKSEENKNLTDSLLSVHNSMFYDNIMYEKFIFYAVLCLITFNMSTEFVCLLIRSFKDFKMRKRIKQKEKSTCSCCKKKLDATKIKIDEFNRQLDEKIQEERQVRKVRHEINYTKDLLKKNVNKPISYMKYLFDKYIYDNKRDFRFSKQFINTHIIAFILLYYITCIIIRKSNQIVSLSSNFLILLVNFIFKVSSTNNEYSYFAINSKAQLNLIVEALFRNISFFIILSCCFTSTVYVVQLFLGIKNYHKHVLNAYKGVYVDIPSPKRFSNTKLASSSLHYSGYAIGYLLWGYLILFEVTLVIIIVIRFLIKFYFITENLAKIFLPIITIFLFKKILIWYLCRFFLVDKSGRKFGLRNSKLYFLLNHFNFFFDCFLGSFVCFMRMAKSSLAALFFMPRLDYSIFGRYLERTDMGYISYVTFIHMEVNQTHPVKCCFIHLLKESIKKKKPLNHNESYHHHHHHHHHQDNQDYSNISIMPSKRQKMIRNKWFLAYTLIHNPFLKKERKRIIYLQNLIPKVESFEQFFERRVKNIFFNDETKKKSKSTSCLTDDFINSTTASTNNNNQSNQIKTSTLNYRTKDSIYNSPAIPILSSSNIIKINQNFNSSYLSNDYLSNNSVTANQTFKQVCQNSSADSSIYGEWDK